MQNDLFNGSETCRWSLIFTHKLNYSNFQNKVYQMHFCLFSAFLDSHIACFSHQITSQQELRDLGTGALKLEKSMIDNALYEQAPSIQDAAREVLTKWANMQQGRREAYVNLLATLKEYKMNQLAAHLRKLVEGTEDAGESKNFLN